MRDSDRPVFFDIPIPSIGLSLEDAKYRFSTTIELGPDDRYLASFDFGRDMLTQLTGKIPDSALDALEKIGPEGSNKLVFRDALLYLSVKCRLGDDIDMQENANEIFLPLNPTFRMFLTVLFSIFNSQKIRFFSL